MNPSSTENCPDSLFSQLSNTGALIASSTTRYQQESSPASLPLQLRPFPIDQDQPNVVSLPILRSAAQRLAAATPGMSSYESGVAALPHDGLSQSFAPPSTSQLPPSSLVSASSSDPLSSTAATPDNAADGSSSKKQSSKMFRCTGFGDCSMTFTRSEHLARHVRKHTGERPFKCHCGRTFSRLDNVRQHAATVHAELATKNAQCISDLVALHNSLSASTMQKQRDAGMIVQDQEREAEKVRKKLQTAENKPPRKSAGANPGVPGTRRKGMAAEKKAREQAEALEAREKRQKEEEEEGNQQQQQQQHQQAALQQQEGSSISGSVQDGASSYPVSPPSAPAPPSIPSAYASPYSTHSFAAPPPSGGNMPYPSYGQAATASPYGQSMGMYGSATGVEHLYGYPPQSSSQHQQPPSPQSSANFYPPPQTQSPHPGDPTSSRDHHRSNSSQLNSSQNGDNRYSSTPALGYPSSTAMQGYPTDQNKVSLPSISALLPAPFPLPNAIGSSSNPPDSQSQTAAAPITDHQNTYYGNANTAARSQYGYPSQGDLAQQQQFAMSQASMYPPYDPYARPPSAGAQSDRGDNPPSLSNGSSATGSSSFPADSPSNQQLHDSMSQQAQQHGHYSHLYHSPYPAPPHSYASAMMYGAPPHMSYHQQASAASSPYGLASHYASQHYPITSHPSSKYPYPPAASYALPSPLQMHSQPPPQPQHHIHFHLNAAGQSHSTAPSHEDNNNNAPRSTPLYAPPTYQHPQSHSHSHSHSHPHSRDNSNRSSIASPATGWAPPPVTSGLLNGGAEQSMQHSNSQNGGGGSGMFSGPTNILKRERDDEDLYSRELASKRRMYEDQQHQNQHHSLAIGR